MTWEVVALVRNPFAKRRDGEDCLIHTTLGMEKTEEEAANLARFMAEVIVHDGYFVAPDMDKVLIMAHEIHSIIIREATE